MESKKIEALLYAVKLGSFMKAADVLGYTPSGLVHMMNGLEKELGFALTQRGRFGVKLSSEGERLVPLFEDLLAVNQQIEQEIEQIQGEQTAVIRLGAYSSISTHWIPDIIKGFKEIYPNVEIEIRVDGILALQERMENQELDLYLAGRHDHPRIEFMPLQHDRLMVILPEKHPLGDRNVVAIDELEGELFIVPSFGLDYEVGGLLDQAKVKLQLQSSFVDDAAVVSMVSKGLGISIISELVLKGLATKVKVVPLSPNAYRDLGIGLASMKKAKPIVKELIGFIQGMEL